MDFAEGEVVVEGLATQGFDAEVLGEGHRRVLLAIQLDTLHDGGDARNGLGVAKNLPRIGAGHQELRPRVVLELVVGVTGVVDADHVALMGRPLHLLVGRKRKPTRAASTPKVPRMWR